MTGVGQTGKVEMICGRCGSDLVTRDAWAEWSVERQQWVLGPVFDHAMCHRCERRSAIVARPLG